MEDRMETGVGLRIFYSDPIIIYQLSQNFRNYKFNHKNYLINLN